MNTPTKRKRGNHPILLSDPYSPGDKWPTPKRVCVKQIYKLGYTGKAIYNKTKVPRRLQADILNSTKSRPGRRRSSRDTILSKDIIIELIYTIEGRYSRRIIK